MTDCGQGDCRPDRRNCGGSDATTPQRRRSCLRCLTPRACGDGEGGRQLPRSEPPGCEAGPCATRFTRRLRSVWSALRGAPPAHQCAWRLSLTPAPSRRDSAAYERSARSRRAKVGADGRPLRHRTFSGPLSKWRESLFRARRMSSGPPRRAGCRRLARLRSPGQRPRLEP